MALSVEGEEREIETENQAWRESGEMLERESR
jgi:hypothetical protein